MEDVIFNGSAKRRPAKFAEVIMTIDNSDGLMKIDYEEVSVSRRLHRTGESEYFINRKKVRLKDIVELFLNTGIGREGYSVIGQGRISEIISLKSEERRELFEEAAGISKFRYRKNEARNKLEQTTENALRVNDILTEMAQRLPTLERQSAKAQKYIVLRDEKKELDTALWAVRRAQLIELLTSKRNTLAERSAALDDVTQKAEKSSNESERLYVEGQKLSIDAEGLRREQSELIEKDNELSSAISVLENDLYHFDITKIKLSNEKESLSGRILEGESNLQKLSERCDTLTKESEKLEKELEEKNRLSELTADEIEKAENELSDLREESEKIADKKRQQELIKSEGEGAARQNESRAAQLRTEISELEDTSKKRTQQIEKLEKDIEDAEDALDTAKDLLSEASEESEETENLLSEAYEERQRIKASLNEAVSKRDTLMRMERLFEGFSGSVKEVMLASEEGRLKGIFGPVSKLFTTDERYVTAIETTLGAGIQNVAVEDERSAKEAIDFLKRTRSGRATFLPLTTIRPKVFDASSVKRMKGFIGNASELIKCDKKFTSVLDFLLGRTLIAETIDDCASIAKALNYSVRVVSLDGQVINSGGSFTGGQVINKTGILTRNSDIAKTEAEISSLKEKLSACDTTIKGASAKKELAERREKAAEKDCDVKRNALISLNTSLSMESERQKDSLSRIELLKKEYSALSLHMQSGEEEKERLTKLSDEWDKKLSKLRCDIASLLDFIDEKRGFREKLIAEHMKLTGIYAAKKSDKEYSENELEACRHNLGELKGSFDNTVSQINDITLRTENAKSTVKEKQAEREICRQELDEKKKLLSDILQKISECEVKAQNTRIDEKKYIAEKEKLTDICRSLESDISKNEDEYLSKETYFAEEYELNDEDIAAFTPDPEKADTLGGELRLSELKYEIKRLGSINMDALEEYTELKKRHAFMTEQYEDIIKSQTELEKLIASLEKTMREQFLITFESIRKCFKEIFTELFGGGTADIKLSDENDILTCGIDICIQPPGKLVKSLSLLSGGEQAFVAIALYFSLLRINPSPFCIFDEIESALDEANVIKYAEYMRNHSDSMQFIAITHRRGTMDAADILYGVTMQEKGVSDYICLEPGKFTDSFAEDSGVKQ